MHAEVVAVANGAPSGKAGGDDVGPCAFCAEHGPQHGWHLFSDQMMHALAG